MKQMGRRPNIFKYATGELSQDAMLCWLLEWAKPDNACQSEQLHAAGKAFLEGLFKAVGVPVPDIHEMEILQQDCHTDILVLINRRIALLIEDKVEMFATAEQITGYKKTIQSKYGIEADAIHCVLVKTGQQGVYNNFENQAIGVFQRSDFLQVLSDFQDTESDILNSFVQHLNGIQENVNRFRTAPVSEWDRNCWSGFFSELQKREGFEDADWDYVANRSGGFMGFWWHSLAGKTKYLQIEGPIAGWNKDGTVDPATAIPRLCFKIVVEAKELRSERRNEWHNELAKILKDENPLNVERPARFGTGTYMTAAVVQNPIVHHSDGKIDFEATVQLLHQAATTLDQAVGGQRNGSIENR